MKNKKLNHNIFVFDTLGIRESIKIRHKAKGFSKFKSETVSGWFPSCDFLDGVQKQRIIDKGNNKYFEIVKDEKLGKIIHICYELLSNHRK
ncbi:MAG: hypothetical protein A3C58_03325 [Candidatus Staskawiczbacteria bacterium RIFCSPHIGHO2_02_FULL_34_10]|uniref:Uncharacterized protein n=2 Tax=Candidatus Staskawicziibacteriota TaxID=1817916 RepID=A0A1G2HJJ5_9BACT|nr:MAG: hypothetical protein A2639_00650 [Candidatus Staskawiczbacteria bacterium RIFCSPHIGHO2_01_FULL_34_27]OGZ67423.1 MAG: hypothetical protein A3C58_03325 [Candidatus Staskawiczbacteria bacterium RIFCSPHIGHO2_02_FULL_34_10]